MGAVALLVILMFIMGCFFIKDDKVKTLEKNDYGKTLEKNDYGVFLNADASSLERFKRYDLIVIDAQYFTKKDIESLHQNGTKVYTYLNIEKWVDVSVPAWQKFIEQLSKKLFEKGVDGFFIDNCDVYYYAPRKSIFEGLTAILQNIMTLKKAVIINGGDTYVTEYRERYGAVDHIMTGVNQESVWSGIDFDKGTFNEQTRETREYYSKYLEACKADGMEVYLLEYTTDEKLIQKIKKYCKEKNFHFYISNSLELQ